ncbi:MAG TPA: DUF4402 domain-containing protein [Longimicrobiales bacterium]|nr:DUF4402 domain-containing protein [Longimicrobiales bacterium]
MHFRATLLSLSLLLAALPAASQQVPVSASVPLASPTGSGVRNLAFGAITPMAGQTVQVDVPAAPLPVSGSVHAGEFRYDVTSARGLDFTLTVPAALTGPGLVSLPVTFAGTQYGAFCVTEGGSACALTAFDPSDPSAVRVCYRTIGGGSCHPNRVFPVGSELAVYVGGLLSVPQNARAGDYSATITLTIVQVY